jgi:hypothetical protein
MSHYCYVIINNAGHSWPVLSTAEDTSRDGNTAVLSQLLQEGWVPVRETPMGGGTSPLAHSLVLLEKAAAKPKATRGSKASAASR